MRRALFLLTISSLAMTAPALAKDHGGAQPQQGGQAHGGSQPHGGGGDPHSDGGPAAHGNPRGGGQPQKLRVDSGQAQHGDSQPDRGGGKARRGGDANSNREAHGGGRPQQMQSPAVARSKGHGRSHGGEHVNRFVERGNQGHGGQVAPKGHGRNRIVDGQSPEGSRRDMRESHAAGRPDRGAGLGFRRPHDEQLLYRDHRGGPHDRANVREAVHRDYGEGRQWMRYRDARDFEDNYRPAWSPLIQGCPPGLAKKHNGCMPPGQAKRIWGYEEPYANWYTYPYWYRYDDRYDWRYDDGYLYRVDRTTLLISAFLPLLGGALYYGNVWPSDYADYAVDPYYVRYYGYGDDEDYRYADGAIFAVDHGSQRIEAIVALLTGDRWTVGSRIPDGYDIYNVPPEYRDRYYDSDDAWYRYSDGYIYEIDPTTLLVRKVIELLSNA